jgi:adenosine deaminase
VHASFGFRFRNKNIPCNFLAIEANPVSNQMLGYVPDQRHHPAITYLRYGIPVVLGADDPATFGYNEFTLDWLQLENFFQTLEFLYPHLCDLLLEIF